MTKLTIFLIHAFLLLLPFEHKLQKTYAQNEALKSEKYNRFFSVHMPDIETFFGRLFVCRFPVLKTGYIYEVGEVVGEGGKRLLWLKRRRRKVRLVVASGFGIDG